MTLEGLYNSMDRINGGMNVILTEVRRNLLKSLEVLEDEL